MVVGKVEAQHGVAGSLVDGLEMRLAHRGFRCAGRDGFGSPY